MGADEIVDPSACDPILRIKELTCGRGANVRVLPMNPPAENSVDRVVEMIPEVVTKITEFIDKKKDKSENKD